MTANDPFNHPLMGTPVEASSAASALADVIRAIGGGTTGLGLQATAASGVDPTGGLPSTNIGGDAVAPQGATSTGNGQETSSPVPAGTSVEQGYGNNGHPGVDLGVPLDTQILAAETGTVTHAANDDPQGYGEWIEITGANGIITRYGHLHGMNVKVGDQVNAGQIIGTSGGEAGGPTSGNSSGAHLHFEVRVDGHTVDPTPFLAGGYQVIGGQGGAVATTADPKELARVALHNVINGLSGQPVEDQPAQTTDQQTQGETSDTGNFAEDILKGVGAPVTPENVRVIEAWMRAEGGASHNNPLNTTQDAPGASNFNDVGVKTYSSYQQGVQATVQTLLNGMYANIIDALKKGNSAKAVADAIANSPWGTGGLVQQIVGGG